MERIPKRAKKVAIVMTAWAFFVLAFFLGLKYALPYSISTIPQSDVYLDRNGKEIAEVAYDSKIRHRDLAFEGIPEFYKRALVTLEDRSFWNNEWISLRAIARSTVANLKAGAFVQWGSTITSQLVRNIEGTEKSRSFGRKLMEFAYAVRITGKYSKEEILTGYVNRVAYWRLSYWLASAAKAYFAKDVGDLTKAEQISLLILPKNPRAYDPNNEPEAFRQRFELVTNMLTEQGLLSEHEKQSVLSEALNFRKSKNSLPYVIDFLEKQNVDPGTTTFDIDLTNHVDELAKSVLTEIGWKNVTDYAVILVDRATNELRVMIWGASYANSQNGQVNAALAPRQAGSTLKPFIYLLAARDFAIRPEDTILDLPVSYKTDEDYSYEPKNYSKDFKGVITYAEALAESVNVPAVVTLEKLGIRKFMDFLRSLGVSTLIETPEHYGLSLALWSGETSLYELTRAYGIFSNRGSYCEFVIRKWETSECERRMDRKYVDMIESILTSRENKMRSFPVNSALDFSDRKVFVKTGTSRNFRDNWAMGYTDRYLLGVWSGNKNAENMRWVSGATWAWEIFARIVRDLEPSDDGFESNAAPRTDREFTSILSPLNGSVYKIDPSRPIESQAILLSARTNIAHTEEVWYLDGKKINNAMLAPTPGEHRLKYRILRDGEVVGEAETGYLVEE